MLLFQGLHIYMFTYIYISKIPVVLNLNFMVRNHYKFMRYSGIEN